jgi:hypothetical protein
MEAVVEAWPLGEKAKKIRRTAKDTDILAHTFTPPYPKEVGGEVRL